MPNLYKFTWKYLHFSPLKGIIDVNLLILVFICFLIIFTQFPICGFRKRNPRFIPICGFRKRNPRFIPICGFRKRNPRFILICGFRKRNPRFILICGFRFRNPLPLFRSAFRIRFRVLSQPVSKVQSTEQ